MDEPLLDPSEIMGIPIFEDERSPEELKTAAAEAAQAAAQEKRDRQMMERLLRDAIPKPGRAPQQHCEHRHYVFKPEPLIGLVVFGDENMPIPPCIAYLRRRDTDGAHKGKSQQPQTLGDVAKEMRQVVEDEDAFIRVVEKLGRNRKEEWKLTADLHDTSGILRALLGAVVSNNTRPECGELQSLVYSCGNGIIGGYR